MVDECEPECALWGVFNHIYEENGFEGVLRHVDRLLKFGSVDCVDEETELYRITTMGWSDDEYVLDELNHFLSLFRSNHYVGYVVGGAYYYAKDIDNWIIKLIRKEK